MGNIIQKANYLSDKSIKNKPKIKPTAQTRWRDPVLWVELVDIRPNRWPAASIQNILHYFYEGETIYTTRGFFIFISGCKCVLKHILLGF